MYYYSTGEHKNSINSQNQTWCVNVGEHTLFGSIVGSDYSWPPVIALQEGRDTGRVRHKWAMTRGLGGARKIPDNTTINYYDVRTNLKFNLYYTEKIGASVYPWAMTRQITNGRQKRIKTTKKKHAKTHTPTRARHAKQIKVGWFFILIAVREIINSGIRLYQVIHTAHDETCLLLHDESNTIATHGMNTYQLFT